MFNPSDASGGVTGGYTLSFSVAMSLGLIVCLLVGGIAYKTLVRRGRENYLPWLLFGSFFATALITLLVMPKHIPDRMISVHPDNTNYPN